MSDNEEHAYKAFLESIGDSIVVVADDEIVRLTYIQRPWTCIAEGTYLRLTQQDKDRQYA